MTAFRPGQSPPPVRTPTRIRRSYGVKLCLDDDDLEPGALARGLRETFGVGAGPEPGDVRLVPAARSSLRLQPHVTEVTGLRDHRLQLAERPFGPEDRLELADLLGSNTLDRGEEPDA